MGLDTPCIKCILCIAVNVRRGGAMLDHLIDETGIHVRLRGRVGPLWRGSTVRVAWSGAVEAWDILGRAYVPTGLTDAASWGLVITAFALAMGDVT